MSLFSSIQQANNSLRAAQIGLQVVGQNIANANTPGYAREEVVLTPAPTQKYGNLLLGLGVQVKGIVQKVDRFVDERLRMTTSDRVGAEVREQTYLTLERLVGELTDTDLSTSLTSFFASLNEVVNRPEDLSVRELAVLRGQALSGDINRLASNVQNQRQQLNKEIIQAAHDINRLTEEIRTLNLRITAAEGGDASASDAVGLRDQRYLALANLAELINIKVAEQESGAVAVFVGGEYLVFEGERRAVSTHMVADRGLAIAEMQITETAAPLAATGGKVGGLIAARDTVLAGFLDQWDEFARTLAFEFNKVFSAGQGLTGFDQVTSEFHVNAPDVALDQAGLSYTPQSGTFEVQVVDRHTGLFKTHRIDVDLDGLDRDTTFADLVTALDAIDGISATITSTGNLTIRSDSAASEFAFAADTSGVLAALGINTFFQGTAALDLGVNQVLVDDPAKFAASRGGIGHDADNAIQLAAFADQPLESNHDASILVTYDSVVAEVTQGSTVAQSLAEGFRVFEETLVGQRLAVSGVNLDEEAVRMITLQRTYQATARYIGTLAELLETLVNL
ncbi:MAG: flagellar hook-associated protein FlgK [Planctomycetes bacterium RBG_16_64_10]|nr:MAG: flagellar hook-associated protein FlgK [Planctomycetes bacterium RBG_16_64_10]